MFSASRLGHQVEIDRIFLGFKKLPVALVGKKKLMPPAKLVLDILELVVSGSFAANNYSEPQRPQSVSCRH